MKNERPTWCHLLFYFTSYVLNMFRTLIYPSSGACDCVDELPHRSTCSQFTVCWRFGVAGFRWCSFCRLKLQLSFTRCTVLYRYLFNLVLADRGTTICSYGELFNVVHGFFTSDHTYVTWNACSELVNSQFLFFSHECPTCYDYIVKTLMYCCNGQLWYLITAGIQELSY